MPLSAMEEMKTPDENEPLTMNRSAHEHHNNSCWQNVEECCKKVDDCSWQDDCNTSCLGITKCLCYCSLSIIYGCFCKESAASRLGLGGG